MNKKVNKTVTDAMVENVAKTREAGEKWTVFMKDAGKSYEELTAKAGANTRTIANKLIENTEKNGVKIKRWTEDDLNTFKKAWDDVIVEQSKDAFFKKVWDDLSKFRDGYQLWKKNAFLPR